MNLNFLSSFILASLVFFSSSPVYSEIYKWIDQDGKIHFTDNPPAGIKTENVKLKINSYSAVEITPLVERLSRKGKVVIYTAAWCGICKKAKRYFKDNKITYVEYDVDKSSIGKRDYKLLRGTGIPIIIVGNKRMNGFSTNKFDKLYQEQLEKSGENSG